MVWLGFFVLGVCWLLVAFVINWGVLPHLIMLALFNLLVVRSLRQYSPSPSLDLDTLADTES